MKEVLKITFGPAVDNYDDIIVVNGEQIHVRSLGVEYNADLALTLVRKFKDEVDAIAIGGFPQDIRYKNKTYSHEIVQKIRAAADGLPVHDGNFLRKAALPWAIKKYLDEDKRFLFRKKVGFFMGLVQWVYLPFFEEQACEMVFADLYFATGVPKPLMGLNSLGNFLKLNGPLITQMPLKEKTVRNFDFNPVVKFAMRPFVEADIYVIQEAQLKFLELGNLRGKTVIIDQLTDNAKKKLFAAGVDKVINLLPIEVSGPRFSASIIEAAIGLSHTDNQVTEEDVLHYIENMNFRPQLVLNDSAPSSIDRFAFIIHPLTKKQITDIPGLQFLKNTPFIDQIEKLAGKVPGYEYTQISGIKSEATGKEVEGHLYLIPATPKILLSTPVEKVYQSLVDICYKANATGAKIIGLGAYTKIVGDAGVTVNERSPIPLTTGNSLSAASTLWAASFGIEKMNLVKKEGNHYQGTCIVIGATGSIGKVCARILAKQWKRIVVVAPRPYKVLELVEQLKNYVPDTEIIGTTNPNKYSGEADLIITSTSAQGEKVMDISQVKPGCVICDVSRPFDISLEDAASRPDILIIASGEVELPGKVKLGKSIGLQGETVYACLAETAVLAMEGLHESFSLSRDLSYEKVVQIDRLSRKHGIRLSGIMGHTGEINENEIALCREIALKKMAELRP
jgi:predicted amino acid dehydrogenase